MQPVPGSNLLNLATQLISTQPFIYYAYQGTINNDIGMEEHSYADGVREFGSIQPMTQQLKKNRGIDLEGRMIEIYTKMRIEGLKRDRPSDQVYWEGSRWDIVGADNWSPIDGWNSVIAVEFDDTATP